MTVETHVDAAVTRVHAEREATARKRDALGSFVDRVADLTPETAPTARVGATGAVGTGLRPDGSTAGGCESVRTAFAETVRPHSVADGDRTEPLLETIGNELTEPIAAALAPTSNAGFSPELKRCVLEETRSRQTETELLCRALDREATSLEAAGDAVGEITSWIATADETPLSELDFGALRGRHETLADHRSRCEKLARTRQSFLQETTSRRAEAGIEHRSLVGYLYGDFPVDHPVLATVARLDRTCRECQRTVRDHLTRRV